MLYLFRIQNYICIYLYLLSKDVLMAETYVFAVHCICVRLWEGVDFRDFPQDRAHKLTPPLTSQTGGCQPEGKIASKC